MAEPLSIDDAFATAKRLRPQIVHLFQQREPLAMRVVESLGKVMRDRCSDLDDVMEFRVTMTEYAMRNLLITERAELERLYGLYTEPLGDRKIHVPVGVALNG